MSEPDEDPSATAFDVDPAHEGARLDRFLHERAPKLSRAQVQKLIPKRVRLSWTDDVSPGSRLRAGGKVWCRFPRTAGLAPSLRFPVLYEDKELFAVNKPAGIVVHPTANARKNSLIELLRRDRADPGIQLAHRLDRETSGVLLLAKSSEAARWCGEALMQRTMRKTYVARVHGRVAEKKGAIDAAIARIEKGQADVRQRIAAQGDAALTRWRVRALEEKTTVLELEPVTGRRHQLRVHCEWIGHPIVGDPLYGKDDQHYMDYIEGKASRERLHLHAWKLEGVIRGRKLAIEAPLPEIFR